MRCTNYFRTARCPSPATVRIYGPDGADFPGNLLCVECAKAIIDEYREELGETWTTVPVDEYGDEIKTLLTEKP